MNQFEIRRIPTSSLVLLLQHEIVAPLSTSPKLEPMARLRPTFDIDGVRHVVLFDRLAAISRSAIGPMVADASELRDEAGLALDLLFKGF